LREAALAWMAEQGLFHPEAAGIRHEHVFFADDRAQKLALIAAIGCTHFIDDLEEVFTDPAFPSGVTKILFSAEDVRCSDVHCSTWAEITSVLLGCRND
jgi:hypothetical protein